MSEEMKRLFRNANIGIAVSVTILVTGFVFLYDNEAALTGLSAVAFFAGLAVLLILNIRDYRADRKRPPHAP